MPDVAALSVAVTADTSGLEAGLARANQQVGGFGSQLSGIGAVAAGVATAGFVALGAGIAGSIKTAADFEKQLSAISAVSGATAGQLDGIRATALQLGKDTSFSASEAAAGMEEMVKAGVSLSDVMGGAGRAALDLAAAGGLSVAESATIASNAMNVFSLKGSDMAHVADVIAGAANASAIDVHDFGFSLSAVGAVAATAGVGLEDTATAIALLGQAGLKGSDAGTSLKTMLLNLSPSTDKAAAEFNKLGLSTFNAQKAMELLRANGIDPTGKSEMELAHLIQTRIAGIDDFSKATDKQRKAYDDIMRSSGALSNAFFDESGNAKSLAEISGILQGALQGLTKEQQLAALETLFGRDAIRAAAIMAKAGSEGFSEMAESMGKVTAQAVANERLNNLAGSIEKLKGSVETGAIILGSMFTPALKDMADAATDAANTAVDALEQIPDVIGTVRAVLAGDWAPDDSIRPFTNAVGEAALTLKAQFGPAVEAVAGFITGTLAPAVEQVGRFFAEHTEIVMGFAVALGSLLAMAGVQVVLAAIGAAIALLVSPIGLVTAAIALLVAAWIGNWGGMRDIVAQAWAAIQPVLAQLVDWLGVQIPVVLNWLATTGWPLMLAAAQAVSTWIQTVAIPALSAFWDWLSPKLQAALQWLIDTGWPGLLAAGIAVSDWIATVAIPALTALVDWMGPQISAVTTWIYQTGWPALVAAGDLVWAMVQQVITFFRDLYIELDKRGVFTELAAIWDTLTTAGTLVWRMIEIAVGWWVKLHDAMLPVQADVGVLVAAGMLTKMSTDMDAVGSSAQVAITPIQQIGAGIKFMLDQVTAILAPIANFIKALNDLKAIIANFPALPSFSLPGMGGGGSGAQTLSFNAGGAGIGAGGDIADYIRQSAIRHGIDPETALRVAMSEGGVSDPVRQSDFVYQGQREQSYGPFQLNMQGGMGNAALAAGIDPRNPAQWREAIDFALANAARGGWGPWHGAAAAGIGTFQGIGTGPMTMPLNQMQKMLPPGMTGIGGPAFETGGDVGLAQTPEFLQRVIDIAPDWVKAMAQIDDSGTKAFTDVGQTGIAQGAALVATTTDSLGNVSRVFMDATGVIGTTITDSSGRITAQWGTMGATVREATDLMAAGALTSVTNLGTGILTSVQTTSGTTIATVTDMAGNVTSQYATLAGGVNISMSDLAAGVTTSTRDLGTAIATTVADMAGNYITTITDLSGNVVGQYVQLGADVVAAATEQSDGVQAATAEMADATTGQITDWGEGVLTITRDTTGEMVATISDMSGTVVDTYTSMGSDVRGTVEDMAGAVIEQVGNVADEFSRAPDSVGEFQDALDSVEAPDFGDIIDELKRVEKEAKKAADAIRAVHQGGEKSGEGDSSKYGKGSKGGGFKAAGGPVSMGETYLVGEQGPELFTPSSSGTIIPNSALSGGGGVQTIRLQVAIGRDLAEEVYIMGRDLTIRRTGSA